MSLESSISDLVKSSDELTGTVRKTVRDIDTRIDGRLRDVDSKMAKFIDNWGVDGYSTIEVGPTRKFKSIQAAWDSLNGKVLKSDIKIKVDDGVYEQNSIHIENNPYAYRVKIEGNLAKPENCILKFTPNSSCISHGAIFKNIQKVNFSGFTLTGGFSESNVTYNLMYIEHQSMVVSEPNSLILNTSRTGVKVLSGSIFSASGLRISGIAHSAVICQAAAAYLYGLTITGNGSDTLNKPPAHTSYVAQPSDGVICMHNSSIYMEYSRISHVRNGVNCYANSYLRAPGTKINNVISGFMASWGGQLSLYTGADKDGKAIDLSKVSDADTGYSATGGGVINADYAMAERCKNGFHGESYGGHIVCRGSIVIDCQLGYLANYGAYVRAWYTKQNAKNCTTLYTPSQSSVMDAGGSLIQYS